MSELEVEVFEPIVLPEKPAGLRLGITAKATLTEKESRAAKNAKRVNIKGGDQDGV